MLKVFLPLILISALPLCAETPNEAATAIHDLIQNKNYEVLFPKRYTEWHKVEKEGVPPEKAIARLSGMFEKQHEILLSVYAQLKEAEFTLSETEIVQPTETGKMASATVTVRGKEIPFRLYEMKDGTWGFHL